MEDFVNQGFNIFEAENLVKAEIEEQLGICGLTLANYDIALPDDLPTHAESWDRAEEMEMGSLMRERMNTRQEKIVTHVFVKLNEMENGHLHNGCTFIDGPGGSGKTYTYRT